MGKQFECKTNLINNISWHNPLDTGHKSYLCVFTLLSRAPDVHTVQGRRVRARDKTSRRRDLFVYHRMEIPALTII